MKNTITIDKKALAQLLNSCFKKGYDTAWMTLRRIRDTAGFDQKELEKLLNSL